MATLQMCIIWFGGGGSGSHLTLRLCLPSSHVAALGCPACWSNPPWLLTILEERESGKIHVGLCHTDETVLI